MSKLRNLRTVEPKDCSIFLRLKIWVPIVFILVFCCRPEVGLTQAIGYDFRFIGLPEPFKSQYITLVEEDNADMVWFVTNNGLHRFDGANVITIDMQSNPSLPDINIRSVMADDRQNLWVATRNKLVRFDLAKWTTSIIPFPEIKSPSVRDRYITVLSEGLDSVVYVGFGNGKLYCIKNGRLSFITRLRPPMGDTARDFLSINTIREPISGELWLATGKGQIINIHHAEGRYGPPRYFEPGQLGHAAIDHLFFSKTGEVIFHAVDKGAFLMQTGNGAISPIAQPTGLFPLNSNGLFLDALDDKKLFFFFAGIDTGRRGLAVYDTETCTWENLAPVYPPFIKGSPFRTTRPGNGKIFIVTNQGIVTVRPKNNPFRTFLFSMESINSVRSILKKPGGPLYVGSYQDRFIVVDEHTGQKTLLSADMVNAMVPWNKDTLLITIKGAPNWYLEKLHSFKPLLPINNNGTDRRLNGNPLCFCRENDSLVWIGTTAGIYLMDVYGPRMLDGKIAKALDMLDQSKVLDIIKVGRYLFVASEEGMFRLDKDNGNIKRLFNYAGNVLAYAGYNCLNMVKGYIWAGTSGYGIIVFDTSGQVKKTITTANGLAANVVYSLPSSNKKVLVGTGKGLSVVDIASSRVWNYASPFYLPSNEFNRSAWDVLGDTVYMGTINGIVRFNIKEVSLLSGRHPPKVNFSVLAKNSGDSTHCDYTAAYTDHPFLLVPAYTRSFSVGLGGDNDDIAGFDILYRLGSNGAWQNLGQQRDIAFVGMGPGSYVLYLGVRQPNGSKVNTVLSLPFTVQPAYYQSLWFRGTLFLIAFLFIWWFIKYREQTLKKEQRLRSRIAGDLHDEVGSALTRIYFQAEGLANAMPSSGDGPSALRRIADGSQEALSSMSDMVWSIDALYDNVADLVDRMRDHVSKLQAEVGCHCTFIVLGSYDRWPMAQSKRQNVFLIFKEAINNALKYSPDGTTDINLVFGDGQLALTVKNKVREKQGKLTIGGHGLKNMAARANGIKGTLEVSRSSDDFVVTLRLKI